MRKITLMLLLSLASLSLGCSQSTEDKLKDSMDEVEAKLAEGKAEARKMLAAALERWEELRPEAERALASLEDRVEELVHDAEALKRLPPDTVERVRARIDALRAKLAQANDDHEQGHTDLAVEKVDDVQRETAQVEELLVERPDSKPPN
jgi:DNA repair exonuclease SbcCD ATPase subunit